MSLQYPEILRSNKNDGYSHVFREAVESVRNTCHVNALGGAEDLYGDAQAFSKYVNKLTEGFNQEDSENLVKLLENNRMQVLQEASLAGIPPITALNAPTIVKMWAKSGLKNVIPTQVVDKPVFSVLFNKPYMLDDAGKKVYLPEGLVAEGTAAVGDKEKATIKLEIAKLKAGVDVRTEATIAEATRARFVAEEMDTCKVVAVYKGSTKTPLNKKMSLERKFLFEVAGATVFGSVDCEARKLQFVSTDEAEVTHIEFEIGVASTQHSQSTEISFEVKKEDMEIPTGRHFEVNLPLEFINDMYALYQIDSASTATETLSNVINQKLEQEIHAFLSTSINDTDRVAYHRTFNVHPNANFAMQPKDWLEELKRVIDFLANKIKSDSYFYQGYFVIYGNPTDIALLPNVSWNFNSAADNVNGINTNFSLGAMSGSNKYVIVGSDLVPAGQLNMIMCPTVDDYATYKYYPYTFNIVNNYLNAQGKKTMPNLMMTKRHTMKEFMPLSAAIKIEGNDGNITYQS